MSQNGNFSVVFRDQLKRANLFQINELLAKTKFSRAIIINEIKQMNNKNKPPNLRLINFRQNSQHNFQPYSDYSIDRVEHLHRNSHNLASLIRRILTSQYTRN